MKFCLIEQKFPTPLVSHHWEQGTAWYEPLPPDIQKELLNWRTQLPKISAIHIPCCYSPVGSEIVDWQLIGFSDASEKAYCGVSYLRSKTVLTLPAESSPPLLWQKHLSHKSRRLPHPVLNFEELICCQLWWWNISKKPCASWLKEDTSNWQSKISAPPTLETLYSSGVNETSLQLKERKEVTLEVQNITTASDKSKPVIDNQRYWSYLYLLRVTAWVFHVIIRSHLFSSTPLSVAQLSKAKIWLFKKAQAKMFPDAVETLQKEKPLPLSHSLQPLNPFIDADSLLRVGGCLLQSQKDYHSHHPLIVHGKHHLTSLIIQSEHKCLCHAGPKLTLGSL